MPSRYLFLDLGPETLKKIHEARGDRTIYLFEFLQLFESEVPGIVRLPECAGRMYQVAETPYLVDHVSGKVLWALLALPHVL
jgi:hypothetical protein